MPNPDRGINCAIYALVQHAVATLQGPALDQEVREIRQQFDQNHSNEHGNMLLLDGQHGGHAAELISLINQRHNVDIASRLLHPKQAAVEVCDVRRYVNSCRWIDALRLLIHIEEHEPGSPAIAALQGWCLYVLGDKDWRRCVAEVLRSGDAAGIVIAARFFEVSGESVAERIAEVP